MPRLLPLALLFFAVPIVAQSPSPQSTTKTPTADEIMARVAANQDRAEELRRRYIYQQHIHVASRNSHGTVLREEARDYTVAPTEKSSTYALQKLAGRYRKGGSYISYDHEPVPEAGSIDAEMVRSFRDDLTGKQSAPPEDKGHVHISLDSSETDGHSTKDGIAKDLFPLTSDRQKQYAFQLVGHETLNRHPVYHIVFRPRNQEEFGWAGDAYIDEQEFQPVFVATRMSRKLPVLVRTMLGTELPGLGFSVQYTRLANGTWFPESFGTEFRVRVLHMFKRNISVSLKNSDFALTHVESKVTGFGEAK